MINIKDMLTEKRKASIDRGCLMAMFDKKTCDSLNKLNHKLISDENLYTEGTEFGRETECHCTIKYGFINDLTELEIRRIINGIKPFIIRLKSISTFQNDKFDVVKFDVESPVLEYMNKRSSEYPNDDRFPIYAPHMTLAYVNKNSFTYTKDNLELYVTIKNICYSPIIGEKSMFELK